MEIYVTSKECIQKQKGLGTWWVILDRLAEIIVTCCGGCMVEIGMGGSTTILFPHAEKLKTKLYSCDTRLRKGWDKSSQYHIVFTGKSLDFIKQFNDKPSLVFLDGCHSYEVVKQEAYFFLDIMLPGGVLFLHDTFPPDERHVGNYCGTVYKLRHEFEQNLKYQCFTFPYTANTCGLTMVMNRPYCCVDSEYQ
jgi:hypothetical protein